MANRRHFFKTIAGAAAGIYVAGRGAAGAAAPALQTPAARRQVMVGGRRVRVVDIHAHCAVPEVEAVVKGTPFERQGMVRGNRRLGPERIELIDRQGIDIQALSTNGFWWYSATDRSLASDIVSAQNEGMARWVGQNSDRFVGAGVGRAATPRPRGRAAGLRHPEAEPARCLHRRPHER